jgi:hypothetical protein
MKGAGAITLRAGRGFVLLLPAASGAALRCSRPPRAHPPAAYPRKIKLSLGPPVLMGWIEAWSRGQGCTVQHSRGPPSRARPDSRAALHAHPLPSFMTLRGADALLRAV